MCCAISPHRVLSIAVCALTSAAAAAAVAVIFPLAFPPFTGDGLGDAAGAFAFGGGEALITRERRGEAVERCTVVGRREERTRGTAI